MRTGSIKDLTGQRFGRLEVIEIDNRPQNGKHPRIFWICKCDCGNYTSSRSDGLKSGAKKSCGCLKAEISAKNVSKNHKHKQSLTRLYQIWQGMKSRCFNANNARYARYGGRGITVCDEWVKDFSTFYNWAIAHGYKEDLTIDRINNDGNYCPDNCRWANITQQCNNRSTNVNITIGNATKTLTEWCEIFELDVHLVSARYHRNTNVNLEELFKTQG